MAKTVKIDKAAAVALLVSLGFKTATQFNDERIVKKFLQMGDKDMSEVESSDPKLLEKILSAVENKETIEVVDGAADEAPKKSKKDKKEEAPAKKTTKKTKVVEEEEEEDADEEEEEDEEDEDEEEEEAPKKSKKSKTKKDEKPAKKTTKKTKVVEEEDEDEDEEEEEDEDEKPAKKSKKDKAGKKTSKKDKPKGGGVIAKIVSLLLKATEKKPITKDGLVDALTDEFEDRDPDSMRGTVNAQVPSRLTRERGLVISKNEKGYWAIQGKVKGAKSEDKKSTKAKAKSKKSKKDADEDDDEEE